MRHERYLANGLRAYQRQLSRYILEQQADAVGFGDQEDEDYRIDDMPVFKLRAESLAGRLTARTTDVLLLAVFAVLFLWQHLYRFCGPISLDGTIAIDSHIG
jgi:hypothetical protein